MENKILKVVLIIIITFFTSMIFSYSKIESKSYNRDEKYTQDTPDGKGLFIRTVLVNENSNVPYCIIAFSVIVGSAIIGIALLRNKESAE